MMAGLCAPNDDDPSFFLNFFDLVNDFKCEKVIIREDFNSYLCNKMLFLKSSDTLKVMFCLVQGLFSYQKLE